MHRIFLQSRQCLTRSLAIKGDLMVKTSSHRRSISDQETEVTPWSSWEEQQALHNTLPLLMSTLIPSDVPKGMEPAYDWFKAALEYNLPGGKLNRALILCHTVHTLTNKALNTVDITMDQGRMLGWAIEMLQCYFLVADDMMDASTTRRGKPCWYLQPNVGTTAINDTLSIEGGIYQMLKRVFKHHPHYSDLVTAVLDVAFLTTMGQSLDVNTALKRDENDLKSDLNRPDLFANFSFDKYYGITTYKTAHYSFVLPVKLAFIACGLTDESLHRSSEGMLLDMGRYFQVQDDYLDCFGDPEVTGKVGMDIQDGKCCWMVLQCLKKASLSQREVLQQHYGRGIGQEHSVNQVKKLYEDMDIKGDFVRYEEEVVGNINTRMSLFERTHPHIPVSIFRHVLKLIHKREK